MKIANITEAKLVIGIYQGLAKTELHADCIWREFGRLALPALCEFLDTLASGPLSDEINAGLVISASPSDGGACMEARANPAHVVAIVGNK